MKINPTSNELKAIDDYIHHIEELIHSEERLFISTENSDRIEISRQYFDDFLKSFLKSLNLAKQEFADNNI